MQTGSKKEEKNKKRLKMPRTMEHLMEICYA